MGRLLDPVGSGLMKLDGATLRGERHANTHEQLSLLKVYWHAVVCQMHLLDAAPICLRHALYVCLLFVAKITSRSSHGSTLHRVQCLVPPN